MDKLIFRTLLFVTMILMSCLFGPLVSAQEKNNDVKVELTAWKIVQNVGKEAKISADSAKPGEIIEHQVVYRNEGKSTVTNLLGTLPIPSGMSYVPGTANPPVVSASLDGKKYATVPLKRKVHLPNGKEEIRDVPPEEYRFLRWELNELAAGAAKTVSARLKISALSEPATPSTKAE